jgi:hypothetical protein
VFLVLKFQLIDIELQVTELDLLSLDSVWKFGEAWETQKIPLHVLIDTAGIFCMNDMVPTMQPFVSVALCLPSHMLALPCLLTKKISSAKVVCIRINST